MQKHLIVWIIAAFLLVVAQDSFLYKNTPSLVKTQQISLPHTQSDTSSTAIIIRVVDGDTIVVLVNGVSEKVRLIGVDTPEIVDPRKSVECFGEEASVFTTATILNKSVTLESDPTQSNRDKYGRLLRYVFLNDGILVNKLLIAEGYGYEYTYDTPYEHQKEFRQAQTTAKELKKGLWAEGVCGEK